MRDKFHYILVGVVSTLFVMGGAFSVGVSPTEAKDALGENIQIIPESQHASSIPSGTIHQLTQVIAQGDLNNENDKLTREYLEPIELKLEAVPGETVSQQINVPIQIVQEDGTTQLEYETITFTLTNSGGLNESMQLSNEFLTSTWTYATCSGWLSDSSKGYLSAMKFRYNGSIAEYNGTSPESHWQNSPWAWLWRTTNNLQGSGTSQFTIKDWGYFYVPNTVVSDAHLFNWTFNGNGNCSATGQIVIIGR